LLISLDKLASFPIRIVAAAMAKLPGTADFAGSFTRR
jgi:hypothetical protein